jgi:hypothetical protein
MGFSVKTDSQLKKMRSASRLFQKALENPPPKPHKIKGRIYRSGLFHKACLL